jgi:drug/metabolite transporter (DMT)-like permease
MIVSFAFNGLEAFGLRVLAGMGLADSKSTQYLLFYYLGGFLCIAVRLFIKRIAPNRTEIVIGGLMAFWSITGTVCLAHALGRYHIPGNVAFPISNGGSLFVVVSAGVLFFRERLGVYGVCGCAVGSIAIALLSIS